jgi:hypothetical protein
VGFPIVGVGGTSLYVDKVQHAVPDTSLSDDFPGELAHPFHRAFQHDCRHRSNRQINDIVLRRQHRGRDVGTIVHHENAAVRGIDCKE